MTKQYQKRVTRHIINNTRKIPTNGEYDALELEGGKIARVDITCDEISAAAVIRAKYRVCWDLLTKT